MARCWNIHTFFGLLISNFWVLGTEAELDMASLYADAAFRLRVRLIASQLR